MVSVFRRYRPLFQRPLPDSPSFHFTSVYSPSPWNPCLVLKKGWMESFRIARRWQGRRNWPQRNCIFSSSNSGSSRRNCVNIQTIIQAGSSPMVVAGVRSCCGKTPKGFKVISKTHHYGDPSRLPGGQSALSRSFSSELKKSTWQDFVSQFNRFTPLTKIWKFLKAFSHKRDPICAFPQLLANGSLISSPDKVVMIFADYFASASSKEIFTSSQRSRFSSLLKPCKFTLMPFLSNILYNCHVSDHFCIYYSYNHGKEHHPTHKFTLDSSQTYNANFTFEELHSAICSSGHTSVGPDGMHYDFFRNISTLSKTKLLQCFNAAWNSGKYPDQWLSSFKNSDSKKRKPKNIASSYRPITLTSCASKLFEKMVNVRLRYFLESNNLLDPHQSGFRKGRSTADNISLICQRPTTTWTLMYCCIKSTTWGSEETCLFFFKLSRHVLSRSDDEHTFLRPKLNIMACLRAAW